MLVLDRRIGRAGALTVARDDDRDLAGEIDEALEDGDLAADLMPGGVEVGCSLNDASATGKVSVNALTLDIRGINMSARGSLPRRAD